MVPAAGPHVEEVFYFVRDPGEFVFNGHDPLVRRPSDRQTKYKDPRASKDGKILDDVWDDIPRLSGTHGGEQGRLAGHALPLDLLGQGPAHQATAGRAEGGDE
jgi:hypothetical protein